MEEHLALILPESTAKCQVMWKKHHQHTCNNDSSELQKENIIPKSSVIIVFFFYSCSLWRQKERKSKSRRQDLVDYYFVKQLCWETDVAAMAVTDTANLINSLTSKSCPSFLSVEPETSSRRKDVNMPFPNPQGLSDFLVFKPMQTHSSCRARRWSRYHRTHVLLRADVPSVEGHIKQKRSSTPYIMSKRQIQCPGY